MLQKEAFSHRVGLSGISKKVVCCRRFETMGRACIRIGLFEREMTPCFVLRMHAIKLRLQLFWAWGDDACAGRESK
jgi:hypothetical protein